MQEVFITKILYKNKDFSIYLINNKLEVKTIEDVDKELLSEFKKIISKKILMNKKNVKKGFYLAGATFGLGMLVGTFLNKDINKLKFEKENNINIDSIEEQLLQDKILDIDDEIFTKYIEAIYENPNLNNDERKAFVSRFYYVNENKQYINFNQLYKTLKTIKINRYDYKNENITGDFSIKENVPTINLYKNANEETLIHEIYHAIKYNTYYWDVVYCLDNHFLGSDEYRELSDEERNKCVIYDIYGNFLEEAHTSLITASDKDTDNIKITYKKEAYIYKVYEKIMGKDFLEENMLKSNRVVGFLNKLIELGCTRQEASVITSRLDLLNKFSYHTNEEIDLTYLTYQICDDLAYVYEKKYQNINDPLLELTVLALTNKMNIKSIEEYRKDFKEPQLYDALYYNKLNIDNYLPNIITANYGTKYGINSITFDYFSDKNPKAYIEVSNYDKAVVSILNNGVEFEEIKGDSISSQYLYQSYTDYYQFAMNKYDNNEDYACFFAAIYANQLINVQQKIDILNYYNDWLLKEDKETYIKSILLTGTYDKINQFFSNNIAKCDIKIK